MKVKPICADMHTHSLFSIDAKEDIYAMCCSSIEKGLRYICFTEHFDVNPQDIGFGYLNLNKYNFAIENARRTFGDNLCILKGLEFSEPHLYPKELERIAAMGFDVILAGIHWIGSDALEDPNLITKYPPRQLYNAYYQEVLKTVQCGDFDVLAHFDLPKRYFNIKDESSELIDQILETMVEKGIVLEINTSSLRKGLLEPSPSPSILERYVLMGGKRVTLGSDAHSSAEIAADFDTAQIIAEKAGVSQIGIFQNRTFRAL